MISLVKTMFNGLDNHIVPAIFDGVTFSDLFDWLPQDIRIASSALVTFGVVCFAVGFIKKFLPTS